MKMCKTFSVLLDAFCGPDSIVATAAANVLEWLKTNEQELENVALHYDRRLPIKLAWFYSEAFNNYFNHAKHDIPSPSTLHFDSFHCQIKMGLSKIVQLPRSILSTITKNATQPPMEMETQESSEKVGATTTTTTNNKP
jgi:hypothetical protein